MADYINKEDPIVGWITFNDGEETAVQTKDVLEHIGLLKGSIFDDGIIDVVPMGGGLMRLDVHLEVMNADDAFIFDEDTNIPIELGDRMDGLRPDVPYFVLFELDEEGRPTGDPKETELWTCDSGALRVSKSDDWEVVSADLTDDDGNRATADMPTLIVKDEKGMEGYFALEDFGLYPENLVGFYNKPTSRYITLGDILGGLVILRASLSVALQMRERRAEKGEEVHAVPLAQYAKAEVFQNHDLSAKVLDGLFNIAMGAKTYELAPRSGKSKESYFLTASEDACTKFFQVRGANTEQVRAILGTVYSLINDQRSAEFVYEGRVWFTVNHIVEELLRTSAGTIRGKDYPNAHALVDAALEMASGAQIKGTSPDGTTATVIYPVNAIRLKEVTFNGETYRDVWGIGVDSETLARYAKDKKHAYSYKLPNRSEPFTLDTVGVHTFLSELLNEARGRLYSVSKNGKITKRRAKTVVIKRAWQGGDHPIFERFSPTRALSSRQKDKLVGCFESELTSLVRDEAHGGRREGMPLYIRAWSERDGGRGRGKGAYMNLCLEVSTTFRAVRDGENGHGEINLKDGIEKAAPDNTPK